LQTARQKRHQSAYQSAYQSSYQSGALVGQSGALGHQSGTLVWSKWHFDVMQAHFWWTLKNDSSSLANSETKAPIKVPIKVHFYAGH